MKRIVAIFAYIAGCLMFAGAAKAAMPPAAAFNPNATVAPASSKWYDPLDRPVTGRSRPPVIHATPTGPGVLARHMPRNSVLTLSNWAGWQDAADATNVFNYAYTEFNVPRFSCSLRGNIFGAGELFRGRRAGHIGSLAATWIGIDGGSESPLQPDSHSLEQDGVYEGCRLHHQGRATYYTPFTWLFWEMIPEGPHIYKHLNPRPGDKIAASVMWAGSTALGELFTLIVQDETDPAIHFDVTEPCDVSAARGACPGLTSEAVQEWPGSQLKGGITLTQYRPFPFYNYYTTVYSSVTHSNWSGSLGATNYWNSQEIVTTGPKYGFTRRGRLRIFNRSWPVQVPGPLLQGGQAFVVRWLHAF
jgi:hypothetical protein